MLFATLDGSAKLLVGAFENTEGYSPRSYQAFIARESYEGLRTDLRGRLSSTRFQNESFTTPSLKTSRTVLDRVRWPVTAMPLLSENSLATGAPQAQMGSMGHRRRCWVHRGLALFSRGVLPEPEVRLPKPSAVTSTSKIEPRPRDAPAPIAKSNEQPPVRDGNSWQPPADNAFDV